MDCFPSSIELTQLNLHRLVLEDYCDQSSNNDYFEITERFCDSRYIISKVVVDNNLESFIRH